MAQGNQDSKVVVATVVSNKDDAIELTCKEFERITIVRGKNWDGGIYWDGAWRKGLKPGDQVDLLYMYANSAAKTPLYGIYTLGSLKDSPARGKEHVSGDVSEEKNSVFNEEYLKTPKGKQEYLSTKQGLQVQNFINQELQDAVVCALNFVDNSVQCASPVWGRVMARQFNVIVPCHRGDIVVLKRLQRQDNGSYVYLIQDNKTSKEFDRAGFEKILQDFNDEQRKAISVLTGVRQYND